jgi:ribosomal protein S18 acetylase RimI-like enzyme
VFGLLATAGATGVHLGTGPANARALGFYERLGFTELLRNPHVVFLGRPLP